MEENKDSNNSISCDVTAKLTTRSGSSAMRKGPIFCTFFDTNYEDVMKVVEQLRKDGVQCGEPVLYNGTYKIMITGGLNKDGVLVEGNIADKKVSEKDHIPTNGTWKNDDGLEVAPGEGRWYPDSKDSPKSYPVESKDGKTTEKKGKKNKNPLPEEEKYPNFDENGMIIRREWGSPGDNAAGNDTITAQVEALVTGHRQRHAKEGEKVEPYTFNGVPFKDKKPDMSEFSMGTITTNFYSSDRPVNFKMADSLMAKQLNDDYKKAHNGQECKPPYTIAMVKNYRETHELTWHEDPDRRTMMKIPSVLHGNTPHKGGINEENAQGLAVFGGDNNLTQASAGNGALGNEGTDPDVL